MNCFKWCKIKYIKPPKKPIKESICNEQIVKLPKAVREQVWLMYIGKKFENKCYVTWCNNNINVFNFHVGHNIPKSKGGSMKIENLRPICSSCNLSMGNKYTIDEWIKTY